MDRYLITLLMKSFFINIFTYFIAAKANNKKITYKDCIIIVVASAIGMGLYSGLNQKISHIFIIVFTYFLQVVFLGIMLKGETRSLLITNLLSNAMVYVGFVISMIIELPIMIIFSIKDKLINAIFILAIESILLFLFFRIKRFKNGFTFLYKKYDIDYIDIIMINVCAVIILAYSLFGSYYGDLTIHLIIAFAILTIIMLIMIQKTLTLYYKQKLLSKTIEDYKSEIASKDEQIKKLSDEKFKISKLNHEFYNRQKALEKKVQDFVSNSNTETSSELSIMESISNLSKGYSGELEKIKSLDKLPTTEIEEIDDMFKYMQSECKNNNIDFKLHVDGNIYHMVNKIIDKDKLVTLIGDHLRDAIIAVNSSTNTFRSIIATIGLHDKYYEFCVHDTGIEFEIDTLLKLGLEPTTTHKDTGGTGIGFITTFETLKETKGSLIIEEKHKMCSNDYTKTLIFRFDGKNEYKIYSYRADEIKKQCKDKRVIVKKLEYK